ncbi:MAG: hypothetical protein IJ758_04095, partial [Clostridia bacterium]|nr:hypothetical protein [Clostridia bacterium]
MSQYSSLTLEDKTKKKIKRIKKDNMKKVVPNWPKIFVICSMKILASYVKSFFFSISLFSISKAHSPYFSGIFYQLIEPIKNLNRPVFIFFSFFTLIFIFLFSIPLDYGILLWFSNLTQDKSIKFTVLFFYYKNIKLFLRSIFFKFEMYFRFFLPTLAFLIPETALFTYTCIKMQTANEDEKCFLSFTVFVSIIILSIGIGLFCKYGPKNLILP